MKITVIDNGRAVKIDGVISAIIAAQEAYELSERLSAVSPKLVQPFEPVNWEEDR